MTDTDNDQVVTIDIILIKTIIIEMTEDTQRKENKMTDIIQKTEEQTEKIQQYQKNRINNIDTDRQNDDPPGIDDYKYTSGSSNDDQEILVKFYNANEDTCNTVVNTLGSNPT